MVKPQFEVGKERVGKGGVVRDPALRAAAVGGVAERAAELGMGAGRWPGARCPGRRGMSSSSSGCAAVRPRSTAATSTTPGWGALRTVRSERLVSVTQTDRSDPGVTRRVLLLAHTGRDAARDVTLSFCKALTGHGIVVRLLAEEAADLGVAACRRPAHRARAGRAGPGRGLRAGRGGRRRRVDPAGRRGDVGERDPVLGVNLGHVGFLAEAEVDDVEDVIDAIVERRWKPEDRLALDVRAFRDGELVTHTFALNEASVEKAARERMIEVIVEIDNRPLSRWGCDGVVLATPTGSTAYNFSAGGPIVWPGVEALLIVPISAHALFARPLVVAPDSLLAVEVIARTDGVGVLWCDGRRAVDLPPGARIEVRRADQPVRLARLHQAPFTDRLVASSTSRCRAGAARPSAAPGSTTQRTRARTDAGGDPDRPAGRDRVLPARARPRADRDHRRDRRRQDDGGDGAGTAPRWPGRQRDGPHRRSSRPRRRRGRLRRAGGVRGRCRRRRRRDRGRTRGARPHVSSEGRSRAWVGGASVPVSRLAEVAEPLVAVHGQSDQHRLLRQRAQRDALDRFGGAPLLALVATYTALHAQLEATERELDEVVSTARERAREADLLRFGLGEIEAVEPRPGEDAELAADEARLGYADALRTAAEQAREALSSESGEPDALAAASAARALLEGVREHDAEVGALAERLAEMTYLLSDLAADVASYAANLDADPARLAAVSERRAALTALTRKYGETVEEVLSWAEASAARLVDLDGTDERIEALRAEQTTLRAELGDAAQTLSAARAEAATRLSDQVTAELSLLAMPARAWRSPSVSTRPSRRPRTRLPVGARCGWRSAGCVTPRAGSTRSSSS